jgi:hypothetical protein
MKSYCPTLFSKLSLWERDFLENSIDLHLVTTSALSTFTSELSSTSLQVPDIVETPSAPSCAIRQPSLLTEAFHPYSPTNTPPLSNASQDTIAPLAVNASPEPFHSDSDNPNLLPTYWDLDDQQQPSSSVHRNTSSLPSDHLKFSDSNTISESSNPLCPESANPIPLTTYWGLEAQQGTPSTLTCFRNPPGEASSLFTWLGNGDLPD